MRSKFIFLIGILSFFVCYNKAYAQNPLEIKSGYDINIISPKEEQKFGPGDEVNIEVVVKGEPPVTRLLVILGLSIENYSGNSIKTKLKLDDSYTGENQVVVRAFTDETAEGVLIGGKEVKIFIEGEGSSDGVLRAGTREPNDFEWDYYGVSIDLKSPELCYKISPEAVSNTMFSRPGNQISYWRYECLFYLALITGDKDLCCEVRSVNTPYLDGSNISKDNCIASVGNPNAFIPNGSVSNAERFLKKLGYKDEEIPAKYRISGENGYFQFYYDIRHSEDFRKRFYKLPDFSQE